MIATAGCGQAEKTRCVGNEESEQVSGRGLVIIITSPGSGAQRETGGQTDRLTD